MLKGIIGNVASTGISPPIAFKIIARARNPVMLDD